MLGKLITSHWIDQMRSNQDDQFLFRFRIGLGRKREGNDRQIAEDRHLGVLAVDRVLDQAADGQRLTVFDTTVT